MEVVTVLQRKPSEGLSAAVPFSERAKLLVWLLIVADVMAVAWMLAAGEWFDRVSPIMAVVTLGGHHTFVLWLAVVGFATLGLSLALTQALTSVRRVQVPFVIVGVVVSTVAVSGMLSVALLVVGAVLLVALVGTALVGGRFVFLRGSLRR